MNHSRYEIDKIYINYLHVMIVLLKKKIWSLEDDSCPKI